MKGNCIGFILLFLTVTLKSQFVLEGIIADASDRTPLPFVNISFNNDPFLGTCSDIDGNFRFEHTEAIHSLQLSYIGYNSQKIILEKGIKSMSVLMQKNNFALEEIVVIAGENPAFRIIRKASKNRNSHDHERINAWTYDSYNKLRVFDHYNRDENRDSLQEPKVNYYYSLMEISSKAKYIAPDFREENIIACKVAGFNNPSFVTALAEIQPSGFHKDNILILDKEFLNPISLGSTLKYDYRIEDTIYQGIDSVYIISFRPRKGKNFDALKGILYINTNGYAIQNVIAEPAGRQKMHLRIEQQYKLIKDDIWFPEQLNFEIELAPRKKDTLTVQGKKYLSNINLNPDIYTKDFGINKTTIDDDAYKKDSVFWVNHRVYTLTEKEKETYRVFTNISKKLPLDLLIGTINEIGDERIQLGPVSMNYTQVMEFNLHEQFRLGLGLYTSFKYCPYISVGGYFAHGFKDKKWKYGGSITIRPVLNKDIGFQISYIDDITEPAAIIQNTHSLSKKVLPAQSFARRNTLNQMDKTYEMEISAYFRSFRYLRTRISGNWSNKIPLYNYTYIKSKEKHQSFKIARIGIQLRFSYKEDFIQVGSSNLKTRSKFPVFYLSYTRGIKGVLDANFEFNKLTTAIESNFFIKGFGRTSWFLQGGWAEGDLPYPILFNGRGSFDRWRMFLVKNTFQTMRANEFVVDKFIYLFLEHNFGSLLLNIGKFKPQVKIYQAIGFGWLDNPEEHQQIITEDLRKGYFESGIMFSDLLRLDVLNFGYFGIGAGVFVRYGPYYLPSETIDNFAFKIDMTFSF